MPVAIVLCLIIIGGAFYGGVKYGGNQRPSAASWQKGMNEFNKNGGPNFGQGLGKGGAGLVSGEILAQDDKSVTLKMKDGGSKIIFFSSTTAISKNTDGTLDDLAIGKNLMITGKTNTDGSVTAETIQIRPDILPSTQK